jgi:hypothetical protein
LQEERRYSEVEVISQPCQILRLYNIKSKNSKKIINYDLGEFQGQTIIILRHYHQYFDIFQKRVSKTPVMIVTINEE